MSRIRKDYAPDGSYEGSAEWLDTLINQQIDDATEVAADYRGVEHDMDDDDFSDDDVEDDDFAHVEDDGETRTTKKPADPLPEGAGVLPQGRMIYQGYGKPWLTVPGPPEPRGMKPAEVVDDFTLKIRQYLMERRAAGV